MTPDNTTTPDHQPRHECPDIHNYPDITRIQLSTKHSHRLRMSGHTQLPSWHTIQRTPEAYRPTEHAKTYITQQISPGFGRQPQIPPVTHDQTYTTRQIPHGCRHSPRVHARHVRPGIHNPPVCPKINHSLRSLTISLTASESPVCRQHWSFIFNPLRLYAVFILFTFATRGCHKMWIENRVIHIVGATVWITHMIIHILGIILWIAWGQSTAAAISICICSINVLQGATPMTRASTLATSCDQTSTNTHQHPLASTITTSVRIFHRRQKFRAQGKSRSADKAKQSKAARI